MIRFESDYAEGANQVILEKLVATNEEQTPGYGLDHHSENAQNLIKEACKKENIDVHFLVGGTQANKTIIASLLRPHQGVISVDSGHIATHETGAIENTGHKVLTIPSKDGKITSEQIKVVYDGHWQDSLHEHTPQPGLVYISQPTEMGTLYTKEELSDLFSICQTLGLPLFVDGARLGYALASPKNNVSLADLADLCDVFYIGGTKVGALFGEAVVIVNNAYKKDFRYLIKQNGAMLAKGRLLGIQFETLFENDLYFKNGQHAVDLAMKIRTAILAKGYSLYVDSFTNQQFPIFPDDVLAKLNKKFVFTFWEKINEEHTAVRICTSWATKTTAVEELIKTIEEID